MSRAPWRWPMDDVDPWTLAVALGGPYEPTRKDLSDVLAKLRATRAVLAYREQELLELKGPCGSAWCRLHRAHSGPCADKLQSEVAHG